VRLPPTLTFRSYPKADTVLGAWLIPFYRLTRRFAISLLAILANLRRHPKHICICEATKSLYPVSVSLRDRPSVPQNLHLHFTPSA
jgi:hypothetical protein